MLADLAIGDKIIRKADSGRLRESIQEISAQGYDVRVGAADGDSCGDDGAHDGSEPIKKNRYIVIAAVILTAVAAIAIIVVPAFRFVAMFTGTYDIDTVQFKLSDPATATSGADGGREPGIWINTNISHNLFPKTIESSKPYSIGIDKTDTSFTYSSVAFTKVQVTYDDGSVETNIPSLPMVIKAREHTSTNSVSGGQIVQTKMRLISGSIPDVITRDQSFTLELEGHFNLDDGSKVPFKIDQHYDVVIEQTKKPAQEVLQDK